MWSAHEEGRGLATVRGDATIANCTASYSDSWSAPHRFQQRGSGLRGSRFAFRLRQNRRSRPRPTRNAATSRHPPPAGRAVLSPDQRALRRPGVAFRH